MNNKQLKHPCVCIFALLAIALTGCAPVLDDGDGVRDPVRRPAVVATPISVPALNDAGLVSVEDGRGQVLLLDFWATWSNQSMHERPDLVRLYEDLSGQEFAVLSFVLDAPEPDTIEKIEQMGLPFLVAMVDAEVLQSYSEGRAVPTKVLLDRAGQIIQTYSGQASFTVIREDIDALMQAH